MGRLGTIIHQQRRTLFVLAIIAVIFSADAVGRSNWLASDGFLSFAAQPPKAGWDRADAKGSKEPADKVRLARQAPDFHLPSPGADGQLPVISRIPTQQKVVFLTLDDGLTRSDDATRLLRQHGIKAPMFLNDEYVREDPEYFRALLQRGMVIGSHTVDHADLTTLAYDQQVSEICDNAVNLGRWLGVRPTLFRPPYGSYDDATLQAAKDCGMRALVMWSAKANGGSMQYQDGNTGLVPGDIVLMHFRPEFAQDFQAFSEAAEAAGLRPANLDDWLQPDAPVPMSDVI